MSNKKAKVSLLVVMLLIVTAFSSVFAGELLGDLSVSYNGEALQNKEQLELYNTDKDRTLTIKVDAKYVDDSLTIYSMRSGHERKVIATGKKSVDFKIPTDLTEGNITQFVFEAVINDQAHDYIGNSEGFFLNVMCPKNEEVNITANLEYKGKTIAHEDSIRVDEGDKLVLSGTSNIGVKLVAYKWDNDAIVEVNGSSTEIVVPALGDGKKLSIVAQATDGKWSNSKTFTILPAVHEDETTIEASLRVNGGLVQNRATVEVESGTTLRIIGSSNKGVKLVSYKWDDGEVYEENGSEYDLKVPADLGKGKTLSITAQSTDGKWANVKVYTIVPKESSVKPTTTPTPVEYVDDDDDELIVEPWMRENDDLDTLAVSLRSEPYEDAEDRANKNIYALNEKVIYYVDYKNGGKDIDKEVKLVLELPLSYTVVSRDGGTFNKDKGTITWTFKDGLEKEQAGTKEVVVKYTSLGNSKVTYKRIKPVAYIYQNDKKKDTSAILNLIVKDFDVEIKDEHDPYMYGDLGVNTFRPDDTITRAEGALVLTRIFGVSTTYDNSKYDFPDLNETYVAARRAIRAARAYGLIEGYPDGNYYPNKTMTRGEFMTLIARQLEGEEGDGFEVKDSEDLIKVYKDKNRYYYLSDNEVYDAHWATGYATLLCRLNMAPVTENNTNLRLDAGITRAEVAQLVNFYLLRAPAAVTRSTNTKFVDVSRNHKLFADIVEATRPSHTWSLTDEGTEDDE